MNRKQLISIILFITCIVFTLDLIRSYTHLMDRRKSMQDAQEKLAELAEQQQNLERKLAGTNTQEFIEQQAREKLNMSKSGELVVILPTISLAPSPSPTPDYPIWEQWVNLFR